MNGDIDTRHYDVILEEEKEKKAIKEIEDFLLTVVSGEPLPYECELGKMCAAGKMIVSFGRLKEMLVEGYNIISAKCVSPYRIDIEYQQYIYEKKDNDRKR